MSTGTSGSVGSVVASLKYVEDEALLHGLAHRVQVEGLVRVLRAADAGNPLAEQVQCLGLGGRSEREVRQVLLRTSRRRGVSDDVGAEVDALVRGRLLGLRLGDLLGREDFLERPHRLARRGRVGLIDKDRERASGDGGSVLGDHRELLQRRDDDARRVARERLPQLLGVLVDADDRARRVVEPGDDVLELAVEDDTVGDDHDLVEDRLVLLVVQPGERVGGPGDGVGLPGPRRVLGQPVGAGAVAQGRGENRPHGVPLLVPREQDRSHAAGRGGLGGRVDERSDEVEPRVALPHLLPQVGGVVPVRVRRVAVAAVPPGAARALVERQEASPVALEPRGHAHTVGVDGEVDERAGPEDQVRRVAVRAVLLHRVLNALAREGILQLGRRGGDAVDDEHEVERVGVGGLAVVELADDGGAVRRVPLDERRRERVRRPEEAGAERDAVELHHVAQDADGAAVVEERRDVLRHLRPGGALATESKDELVPLVGLGARDEADQLVWEEA